ncbi:MAG: hypothetical protein COB49_01575 [Alphaproteobacteria bacterium]|nr:MAG: hypothetical protein COB49_01575 [Alphaproteobacteria bacterium]
MELPDIKFSLREIETASVMMAVNAIALVVLAIATFKSEYIFGGYFENFLEYSGVLNKGWMIHHNGLFLHEIQLLFLVTFCFEMVLIISKYTRKWKL